MVHQASIEPVPRALLSPLEGEVSPHDSSWWKQSLEEHVCAEVHVMMAVEFLGISTVNTTEFIELTRHEVFERPGKSGVKYDLSEAVPQVLGQLALVF